MTLLTAMQDTYGTAPDYIPPGIIVRFGRKKELWAWLFEDCTGGVYGNHRTGERHVWQSGGGIPCVDSNLRAASAAKQEEVDRLNRAKINEYWEQASDAGNCCQYFRNKGIKNHGGLRWHQGAILVPMRNIAGELVGILRIYPDGSKRIVPGSNPTGAFYLIGNVDDRVYIAEGLATAATVYSVTNVCTISAFSAPNLSAVSAVIRQHYPDISIIICADDDHTRERNMGLESAEEAAKSVNGLLAIPKFPSNKRWPSDSDFNDLMRISGGAAVRKCLSAARVVHHV